MTAIGAAAIVADKGAGRRFDGASAFPLALCGGIVWFSHWMISGMWDRWRGLPSATNAEYRLTGWRDVLASLAVVLFAGACCGALLAVALR